MASARRADHLAGDVLAALEDVRQLLWENSVMPLSMWPIPHRKRLEADGRVDARGNVALLERPDDFLVMVCGGLGNLHGLALHSFGPTCAVTRPF